MKALFGPTLCMRLLLKERKARFIVCFVLSEIIAFVSLWIPTLRQNTKLYKKLCNSVCTKIIQYKCKWIGEPCGWRYFYCIMYLLLFEYLRLYSGIHTMVINLYTISILFHNIISMLFHKVVISFHKIVILFHKIIILSKKNGNIIP